jgi:hypothetical protein
LIESSVKQGRIAKTDIFDKQIGVNMKNERAFPTYHGGYAKCDADGMTLRDYFAAKAMQAIIGICPKTLPNEELAIDAYQVADAMLKAREA